jgi:sugar O-acyltransferase (sialic acid O-acetyltransferase NeuD family)
MLIIGTGGLAAQMFDDLVALNDEKITFWSEVDTKYFFIPAKFKVLKTDEEVVNYFNTVSNKFISAIGGVKNRKKILEKFTALGGDIISFISPGAVISPFATSIGKGSVVLSRVELESHVHVGENCLLNKTANVGHGSVIGNNCEITPGVILLGEVEINDDSYIGTGAIILPKVKIGKNVSVAAGAIVKKNVPDNAIISGEFASVKLIKK